MENCLGIISVGDGESNFGSLCKNRPVYMLPFGGRYRLIDFTISNMVNNGVKTVAVFTGDKIRSTMDHLGNGRPWELNRRFNGLFIFPPIQKEEPIGRNGEISEFFRAEQFLNQAKEEYILLHRPNMLAKVDLKEVFKHFRDTGADVTLIYKKQIDPWGDYINCDKIHLNKDGSLINIGLNLGTEKDFNFYIGMCLIKKSVFLRIVKESMEKGDASYFKEALLINKDEYKINSYEFKGQVANIRNLKTYYDANLNLLNKDFFRELFFDRGTIYTKSEDEPPTLYMDTSNVQNSLIANGCIIEGTVENSILFRGVNIGKGAIVRDSILMQKVEVMDNAIVVNTIMDKNTSIGEGIRLAGSAVMPYVVEKYQKIRKD